MADDASDAAQRRRGDPERVVTFTDGVFAIIITILVLEIAVPPDLSEASLRASLDDVAPTMLAWVISFLITGMYWVWHRDLFNQIRRVNRDLVWLNLLFLLPVALVPFAASVLGDYHADAVGLRLYGAVLIVATLMRFALYAYAMHHPQLLWDPPSDRGRRQGFLIATAPLVVYVVAVLLADAAPTVSLALFLALPLAYFLLVTGLRHRAGTSVEADDFS